MKIIKFGSSGEDVSTWQIFLRGLKEDSHVIVNGFFDNQTNAETKEFQAKSNLKNDGIVGPSTLAVALNLGFCLMSDDSIDENSSNWPVLPSPNQFLSPQARIKLFGAFTYESAPVSSNPEAIIIKGDWVAKNIKSVAIPQLKGLAGAPANLAVQINEKIADQTIKLFSAWESANLKDKIKTWGGSWVPRFIRGSRSTLSNHAWGTAFDINAQWNMLGSTPALKGQLGSTRELVQIAYEHGFYWGGWFPGRPDGMHFEAYKIL